MTDTYDEKKSLAIKIIVEQFELSPYTVSTIMDIEESSIGRDFSELSRIEVLNKALDRVLVTLFSLDISKGGN